MSEREGQVSHVASLSPEDAASLLLRIAAGLRRGRLRVRAGDTEIHMRPTRSVRFELHVRGASAHVGGRVDVDMSWTRLPAEPGEPAEPGANGAGQGPPTGNGHRNGNGKATRR
jgi:amphi-Trp domain-containing protein